jgi:hypothetical protein
VSKGLIPQVTAKEEMRKEFEDLKRGLPVKIRSKKLKIKPKYGNLAKKVTKDGQLNI